MVQQTGPEGAASRSALSDQDSDPRQGTSIERARTLLAQQRSSIDNIDAALVHLLAERFRHTQAVGRLKARHGLPPADPDREARQVERLHRLAEESGLDPEFAKAFMRFIVTEVIRHHERILDDESDKD